MREPRRDRRGIGLLLVLLAAGAMAPAAPGGALSEESGYPGRGGAGADTADSAVDVASPVRLEAVIDSRSITVGEVTRLVVRVHYPGELTVGPVVLPRDLGDLMVKDFQELPPEEGPEGRRIRTTIFELTSFMTGGMSVPGPEVSYIGVDGVRGRVVGDSLRLEVASVLPDSIPPDSLELRDIRELAEVPGPGFPWRDVLVVAVPAVVGAALVAWLLRRRRRARQAALPAAPAIPPWEEARRALAALAQRDLPARGELEVFYVGLTVIIRSYLGARYGFPALDMTTTEIMAALTSRRGPTTASVEALTLAGRLLEGADLVKFARGRPPTEAAREDLVRAGRLVSVTEPVIPGAEELVPTGMGVEQAAGQKAGK